MSCHLVIIYLIATDYYPDTMVVHTADPWHFQILVSASSGNLVTTFKVYLEVSFPSTYPDVVPKIKIRPQMNIQQNECILKQKKIESKNKIGKIQKSKKNISSIVFQFFLSF